MSASSLNISNILDISSMDTRREVGPRRDPSNLAHVNIALASRWPNCAASISSS